MPDIDAYVATFVLKLVLQPVYSAVLVSIGLLAGWLIFSRKKKRGE